MLITKNFVILNNPKTGSSFVRTIVKELFNEDDSNNFIKIILIKLGLMDPELQELLLPNIKLPNRCSDQHGTYSQIPKKHLNKKVISVVRNPYQRFLSAYEFKFWATHTPIDEIILKKEFPNFPNLTIDEFVDLMLATERIRSKTDNQLAIGNQTIQFIQMFFKKPFSVLSKIDEYYFSSKKYKNDLGVIKFLRQENLNRELYDVLSSLHFKKEKLDFILNHEKVNVTESTVNREVLWTQKSINYVEERERYYFNILTDFRH